MSALYSIVWWLALPLVLLRLWWRGRKEPGYRQHIGERLGFYGNVAALDVPSNAPGSHSLTLPLSRLRERGRSIVWVHAVSVGETRAAEPLITALLEEYPDHDILLTHMTATGRETGASVFSHLAPRVMQSFLPYDTGWMMSRFLRHFSPRICILMETEIWPNLIAQCVKHRVPVALVNARMSARSLSRARFASSLMATAAANIACVAAQTHADAERLQLYGAVNVQVTGSVKFDVLPPEASVTLGASWRACLGERPVLLCASTREGEEDMLLDALPSLVVPDALIVIVPRHPQRFDAVALLIKVRGLALCRRSELADGMEVPKDVRVLLGDSMGEMFAYYAAADLAFIGGSLLPLGGQNLIEACAVGKPVLVGPHTFNFGAITEDAVAAGAAVRVLDATELMLQANKLLKDADLREEMGRKARTFAQQQQGATERTMALLRPLIGQKDIRGQSNLR